LIAQELCHHYIGYNNFTGSLITAVFIAIFFIPLKNKIQDVLDKIFFHGTQAEIAHQNELLMQEVAQTERLRTVAILASGIAHEIKNPLTVIQTFGEYLPTKMDDKEFLKKFSPLINKEIERINALIHELLTFSKPNPLTFIETDFVPLIESTIDLCSNSIHKNNISVTQKYLSKFNYYQNRREPT